MTFWPLAQAATRLPSEVLSRQTGDPPAELPAIYLWPVLAGLCGIVAIALVWLVASRYLSERQPRPVGKPWRLFFQLAWAHRLRWRDAWLLYRLACRLRLIQPAVLFVQPENFAPSRLDGWRAEHIARLEQLRERLFAGLGHPPSLATEKPAQPGAPNLPDLSASEPSETCPAELPR